MLKVCKFGGSSVAGAEQFRKVRDIVLSDPSRRVVVISAAGKRTSDDHKLTDLLYLCHAHLTYGVACSDILAAIRSRFVSIRDELGLSYRVEDEFDAYAATLSATRLSTPPTAYSSASTASLTAPAPTPPLPQRWRKTEKSSSPAFTAACPPGRSRS